VCFSIGASRGTSALNNDFSRRHPSALAGGRLILAETVKANGIDFYRYLMKLMTELPNLLLHQKPEISHNYLPWSENIQSTFAK